MDLDNQVSYIQSMQSDKSHLVWLLGLKFETNLKKNQIKLGKKTWTSYLTLFLSNLNLFA